MKKIGIIAEYNPFHLGHLYQINKIKELYPDSLIIVLVSGYFTERGDVSVINKWDKTKICLDNGIDIVLEFPTLYSTQSADVFAKAALTILNDMQIDFLAFGSETNDINLFKKLANIQLYSDEYDEMVKKYLSEGLNYPTAMSKALLIFNEKTIDKPNDLLALSYIKEIIKNNYKIVPLSIKRDNNYHSNIVNGPVISANLIRKKMRLNEEVINYIPNGVNEYLYKNIMIDNALNLLKYQVLVNNDLENITLIEEGIDNRIRNFINSCKTWDELVNSIKTKRYTYNRINRILLHILLNIKKEENVFKPYIRILGFSNNGQHYLNKIKKELTLPLFTGYKPNLNMAFDIEYRSSCLYSLIVNDNSLVKREYQNKPIIK